MELYGPPNQTLVGFELLGINGNGGAEYGHITLTGSLNNSGYYVVAHPQASAATLAVANQTATGVDYQNGPDSIVLLFQGTPVDSVAYGNFTASDVFAGEGTAAQAPPLGQSAGRNTSHADTNNNVADFAVRAPTPGGPNEVTGSNPVARLSCPTTVRVRETFTLDAAGSSDVDGALASYAFSTGDGGALQTVTTPYLMHAYQTAGTFTAAVTVRDASGLTDRATCEIVVQNQAPDARLICPVSMDLGLPGAFDASSSTDANGGTLRYSFSFGDNTAAQPSADGTLNHTYAAGGVFTVTVTVTDDGNLTDTASCDVGVVDHPPVAAAVCPSAAVRGVDGSYSAQGSTDDGALTQYTFEFGDNTTPVVQTQPVATHRYTAGGSYTVTITVRDSGGQTDSATCGVAVEEPCGNSQLDDGELCDDGNSMSNDGCSSTCQPECAPVAPGSGFGAPSIGNYTRICATAHWGEWFGYTEQWFSFTRTAPFSLEANVHDGNGWQCPTSYEPHPCGASLLNARTTLYLDTNAVGSGGGYSCGDLSPSVIPALNNLAAGTYFIKVRVDSNGSGFDCAGSGSYIMDLAFGAPR